MIDATIMWHQWAVAPMFLPHIVVGLAVGFLIGIIIREVQLWMS